MNHRNKKLKLLLCLIAVFTTLFVGAFAAVAQHVRLGLSSRVADAFLDFQLLSQHF